MTEKIVAPKVIKPLKRVSAVTQATVKPGKVTFVSFDYVADNGVEKLICGKKKRIPFVVKNNKGSLYLVESYFSRRKKYSCTTLDKKELVLKVNVKAFPYKSEKLNVDRKRVVLSKKDLAIVIAEREIKKKIYIDTVDYFVFEESFQKPLDSYITSHYGTKRVFNNIKTTQHLGNDLRAKVGVPIPSSNRGRVVFAGHLFYSGNIVVLDHGLNIFTIYGHLSKINVTKGSIINRGDIVGLAGKTGRVSGPHLHWGVKINGSWVDGFSLVQASSKK